jgi:hypothetical protein
MDSSQRCGATSRNDTPAVKKPVACEVRALWTPKDGNSPDECEDGYAVDGPGGVAALADGAGSGIFSRQWARELTSRYLADRPDLGDATATAAWILACRTAWMASIDHPSMHPLQQEKVDRTGAAATFLTLSVRQVAGRPAWQVRAVGDSAFFWERDGVLQAAFPLFRSSDFGIAPDLLRTQRRITTHVRPVTAQGTGKVGDLYGLATDAVAQFLLRCHEREQFPGLQRYWDMDDVGWRQEVQRLRQEKRIVNDDSTLVLMRIRQ